MWGGSLEKKGKVQLRIRHKMLIVFSIFVLIFYGTLLVLYMNTQKMVAISEQIVSKNNEISKQSKIMYESLLSMSGNDKKYRLLGKEIYRQYFEEGKIGFEESLDAVLALDSSTYSIAPVWKDLSAEYNEYWFGLVVGDKGRTDDDTSWAPEDTVNNWLGRIAEARVANEKEIERSLLSINNQGKRSVRNGLIGMTITIVVSLLAAIFLSRSILIPLHKLKDALQKFSMDKDYEEIHLNRKDEFGDLAVAFNEMSRQLKEEEELRSEFIATLSHEIRTPLSSIRESVNMILEGVLGKVDEKQTKFLEIAKAEITRINDLLNHLLQVSHLDSASRKVNPELMDPNRLILDVLQSLVPRAKKKNVSMKLHKIGKPPVLIGVKKELQQVLFNLLDNAIKFSPKSGIIEMHLYLNDDRDMLTYRISDQGPGVTEKEQNLIFSKYYRTKSARKGMDGVGLGLSISKRIVQFHDGDIYVKNNEDKGCSFYCSLPCEAGGDNG